MNRPGTIAGKRKVDYLGLNYSLPMSDWDREKYLSTGLKNIQLQFDFAGKDLDWALSHGLLLLIRVNEHNYASAAGRSTVIRWFSGIPQNKRGSIIVQIGCEPEGHLELNRGSRTGWGNEKKGEDGLTDMERHRIGTQLLRSALQGQGYKVCSAGFRIRNQDGRFGPPPNHGPQPGLERWYAHMLEEHGKCNYNGGHLYTFDGTDWDIDHRGDRNLCKLIEHAQQQMIIDELNVGDERLSKEEAMARSLRLVERVMQEDREGMVGRIDLFVMNGTPIGPNGEKWWPPHQLMNTALCYLYLANWIQE